MTELQLLVLLAPAERRDDLVDVLMELAVTSGFTLTPALGYSREHSHFSLREQVAGYRDIDRFEILTARADLPDVLTAVSAACGNERLRYWIADITRSGHLPQQDGEGGEA
jgi:hypothetical protein